MGIGDWDVSKSDVGIGASIDIYNPIVDAGSLRLDFRITAGSSSVNLIPSDLSGNNHGFTRGKIRSVFRLDDAGAFTTADEWLAGLTCMQSQDSCIGSGSCYAGGLLVGAIHSYVIVKYTSGMTPGAGSFTVLGTGSTIDSGEGFVRTLELEWNAQGGGVDLTLRRGTLVDFSDLVVEVDTTDIMSPLFTTVAEGLFAHNFEGGLVKICSFDKTRVFSIST